MAGKIAVAGAVAVLLWASLSFGEAAKTSIGPRGPVPADGKGVHRLGEVRIEGSAEHPGVLFFLPRSKFRLLPIRERHGGKDRLLRDDRGKGEFPE
jgi:hypothetical protein